MADDYPFDITDYVPDYEYGVPGVTPLNPNYLAYISLDGTMRRPTYSPDAPPPALGGLAPAAELNMLDARPVNVVAAPPATHFMYLEIVFGSDDSGVNR